LAPSSIISAVLAMSYFHKVLALPDPSKQFVIVKLLAGVRNVGALADIRLPITHNLLQSLLNSTPSVVLSYYRQLMFRAMMSLAFKAFLRVGEMVLSCYQHTSNCLHLGDVQLSGGYVTLSFRHFKHSAAKGPQVLHLSMLKSLPDSLDFAQHLHQFLLVRGSVPGIFLAYPDGTPLLRSVFDQSLKAMLLFCGFDTRRFKGHSFRIGAATQAAMQGRSDAFIRAAGRWSSDAFKKYIRLA
jgi:hypothetical protein